MFLGLQRQGCISGCPASGSGHAAAGQAGGAQPTPCPAALARVGEKAAKLQHSAWASLLAHNVYPAVQVTRFWWEKCLIGPSFLQGCYMTAYSPKRWPMAMEDQLSLLSSLLLFVSFLTLISKNHERKGLYLNNTELLHQHCVTASWSGVILVLVLPCGGTENGMLVPEFPCNKVRRNPLQGLPCSARIAHSPTSALSVW